MRRAFLPEIDSVRGFAVVMMIANHASRMLLDKPSFSSTAGQSFFVFGSFAPALFFFVTGLGIGFQVSHGKRPTHATLKMLVLFAADLFLTFYRSGRIIFDFLAFIGLSTMICSIIARLKYSAWFSLFGCLFVVLLRYVVAPHLPHSWTSSHTPFANTLLGYYPVPGISYPLSPWLCFPLLGYFIGFHLPQLLGRSAAQYVKVMLASFLAGSTLIVAGAVAAIHGVDFHRFGTVSADYFIVSFGVAVATLSAFALIEHAPQGKGAFFTRALRIRGIACLAVVPIHYVLIDLLARIGLLNGTLVPFAFALAFLVPACFLLGRLFERLAHRCVNTWPPEFLYPAAIVIVGFALWLCFEYRSGLPGVWSLLVGQLTLCILLLALTNPTRKEAPLSGAA